MRKDVLFRFYIQLRLFDYFTKYKAALTPQLALWDRYTETDYFEQLPYDADITSADFILFLTQQNHNVFDLFTCRYLDNGVGAVFFREVFADYKPYWSRKFSEIGYENALDQIESGEVGSYKELYLTVRFLLASDIIPPANFKENHPKLMAQAQRIFALSGECEFDLEAQQWVAKTPIYSHTISSVFFPPVKSLAEDRTSAFSLDNTLRKR